MQGGLPLKSQVFAAGASFISRLAKHWQDKQANLWVVRTLIQVKKLSGLLTDLQNQVDFPYQDQIRQPVLYFLLKILLFKMSTPTHVQRKIEIPVEQ